MVPTRNLSVIKCLHCRFPGSSPKMIFDYYKKTMLRSREDVKPILPNHFSEMAAFFEKYPRWRFVFPFLFFKLLFVLLLVYDFNLVLGK